MVGRALPCLSLSSPAKAGDPVDASVAANLATLVNTGCSAFAEHDGYGRHCRACPGHPTRIAAAVARIERQRNPGTDSDTCPGFRFTQSRLRSLPDAPCIHVELPQR
jgi:hypothetical protein